MRTRYTQMALLRTGGAALTIGRFKLHLAKARWDERNAAKLVGVPGTAAQVARFSHQGINRESPLLSATLPTGEHIQIGAMSRPVSGNSRVPWPTTTGKVRRLTSAMSYSAPDAEGIAAFRQPGFP
jgi:hypothetical protein